MMFVVPVVMPVEGGGGGVLRKIKMPVDDAANAPAPLVPNGILSAIRIGSPPNERRLALNGWA